MDFPHRTNTTSADTGDLLQAPVTLGLASVVAAVISFVAFLSHTPKVDKRSPAFTPDRTLFVGSLNFLTKQWSFWQNAKARSKTGNFSFWLGSYHVVGISGEAARKVFLDHPWLDFSSGAALRPLGVHFVPPVPEIFHAGFHNGRSYFLRRLLDLQKTEHLIKYLGRLTTDARNGFEALARGPSSVTDPSDVCWRIVFKQDCRFMCTDELADDLPLLGKLLGYAEILQSTSALYNVPFWWLPSVSYLKRRYGRYGLRSHLKALLNRRMKNMKQGAERREDAMTMLIENGDRMDWVLEFLISILFIAPANSRILTGHMLNLMAMHPDWQEKIYAEVKAAAAAHGKNKSAATLAEQLDSLPLDAWESSFPTIDICYREAIRMWTAFAMIRLNTSADAIPIPGTDEVIPAGSYVSYNSTEVHYNPELYPNPSKYDPERFLETREEFKKQVYGFVGWGQGRHPCPGMRWAKLQQNIILAYALAQFKWSSCDANGEPMLREAHRKQLDDPHATSFTKYYVKYVPRE